MDYTLRERLHYRFDNLLARGTVALVLALAMVSAVVIGLIAAVVVVSGARPAEAQEPLGFGEAAWESLMRTLDPGTMGGDTGALFRTLMFVITIFGVFVISTLIGILANGLEGRIEQLRKGRSRVVELDHSVILGWSEQVFPIVTELIEANVSRRGRGACVVILGDMDKTDMDDAVREAFPDSRGTRIVCRTGSGIESGDLRIAGIDSARSIVIVAPQKNGAPAEDPDVEVIKTILAITNNPARKKGRYHIVAEIRDPRNFEVAQMVGKDEVELVLVGDLIARIAAQACRQSGLSVVYQEMLDFSGDEIYFTEQPPLAGKTYGDALFAFDTSALLGVRPRAGIPILNPPPDTPINAGDKLIVLAEDDDKIFLQQTQKPEPDHIALHEEPARKPERTLLLGWNWRAPHVINELDAYVAAGSSIHVVADSADAGDVLAERCGGLQRQTLSFQRGDTTDRRTLDALRIETYDHAIVLCYSDMLEAQKADAATLITLLHLRDISDKTRKRVPVVSEMLDINNRALAEVTRADDFIVSDRLVSQMLSQISENKELNMVFQQLFSPEGSEIYLRPASLYVKLGVPVRYATVVAAASKKEHTAVGFRLAKFQNDADKAYGVKVNPRKSETITFGPHDTIIVLAEE